METLVAWVAYLAYWAGLLCCLPMLVLLTGGIGSFLLLRRTRREKAMGKQEAPQKKDLTLILDIPGHGKVSITDPTVLGRYRGYGSLRRDRDVSREHAKIGPWQGRFYIADLDSTNGTYLNGREVASPAQLSAGDVIELGRTAVRVVDIGYSPRKRKSNPNPQPQKKGKRRIQQSNSVEPRQAQQLPPAGTWWNKAVRGPVPTPPLDGPSVGWYQNGKWPRDENNSWFALCPYVLTGPRSSRISTPPFFGSQWLGGEEGWEKR